MPCATAPARPAAVQHPPTPEPLPVATVNRVGSVLALAALQACGGGGGGGATATVPSTPAQSGRSLTLSSGAYAGATPGSDEEAARFLLQAQFSATDAEVASVRSLGYRVWLEQQIAQPCANWAWDWLNAQGYGDVNSPNNYYDQNYPTDYFAWHQLVTAPDALRRRVALALSEIVVVSINGLDNCEWRSHAMAAYWDTLCQHALGNYRDLLGALTLNPAMGYYLNTKGNRKEDSSGRLPDENYAREVMQLFTVGLHQLNADGTVRNGSDGKPLESYTAADISNLARVFTGYDLDRSQNTNTVISPSGGGTRTVGSTQKVRLPMVLTASYHSPLAVEFLGSTIAANTPGAQALTAALDTLFQHPNTGPFLCRQLIQRLVCSNPSAAYVQRVAAVFANNGAGVRGDLAHVVGAILLDDEARNPAGLASSQFGKLREPLLRLVQWARSFGVGSSAGTWKIPDLSDPGTRLGQSPLRSPSVFNFFRPGFVPPGTTLGAGQVAPEFQLVNESSVGGYLNFLMGVIDSGLVSGDVKAAYTAEIALATSPSAANPSALVQRINRLLCAGQLSVATANTITSTVGAMASGNAAQLRQRVCAAVLLAMASAEYLVQK